MGIRGYFGPPDELRRQHNDSQRNERRRAGAPPPRYSQQELRARRRQRLSVSYGGGFDLALEVADIITPLAVRVAAEPNPVAWRGEVEHLADVVHELVGTMAGWLAEDEAREKVGGVKPDARSRSVRLLTDLAPRPAAPELTADHVTGGTWAAVLVDMARCYSGQLGKLLARSRPPNDPGLQGQPSRSARLEDALRPLDHAALDLSKRLDQAAMRREQDARASTAARKRDKERANKIDELRKAGVQV
jgi:hypothetical protein